MRVMSWNVWWRFDGRDQATVDPMQHSDHHWRRREGGILSTLEAVRPDIAGLQEVWATDATTQAHRFADRLGMHAAFSAPSLPPPPQRPAVPDHLGVEVGVGLLSRWRILECQEHRMASGHRAEDIVALAVVVDHPHGPLHVVVSCIDWGMELAAQRLAQTRVLAELLVDPARDGPLPVILTADLNTPPTTPEIRVLTEVMVDAWDGAGEPVDEGHTLSSDHPLAPREAWQIDERIDYVMARPGWPQQPVEVERAFLAGHPQEGVYPSDHYAVVADFLL